MRIQNIYFKLDEISSITGIEENGKGWCFSIYTKPGNAHDFWYNAKEEADSDFSKIISAHNKYASTFSNLQEGHTL